ncbi:HD domain-containing protein [Neptunomonas marina]|uniref:HD domain-containing protein n=1 Tax=Neptunomonas marina TaxID=1815562 RepID=A0A437QAR2_9GAMM|nr:HD domain-containing protein [Neptunomonas marina]RVU31587.1 HD domain-containing protein [Neptunomonas marina]
MQNVIDEIVAIYAEHGEKTYGEGISQTEHAVQCAQLAVLAQQPPEMVTAALLHDIGHLIDEIHPQHGNFKHDKAGADYLQDLFPPAVTEPIRLHAQAKRYLCTMEQGYLETLSEASRYSLKYQGGLMTDEELDAFEDEPFFTESLQLRYWDDQGKDPELAAIPFSQFKDQMAQAML